MNRILPPAAILTAILISACATPDKTIILHNMPGTIEWHRGESVADELCKRDRPLWGCSQRIPSEDKCIVAINTIHGPNTKEHELAHCSGHNEEEARAMAAFE